MTAALSSACGGDHGARAHEVVPVGTIARDVGAKLGAVARVDCQFILAMPYGCVATLPDRSTIPIALALRAGAWEWAFAGSVIDTAPIAAYIRAELEASGTPRDVSCGSRFVATTTIECTLAGGGVAFVEVGSDGSIAALEIEVDPAAAAARSGAVDEAALEKQSRELDVDEEDAEAADDAEEDETEKTEKTEKTETEKTAEENEVAP